MANKASPTRPQLRPKKQDRPSWAGKSKLCYRTDKGNHERPATIWADKRHGGVLEKEIAQLQAAIGRIDRNPSIPGVVEWAEIYDCTHGRFGPVIATYKRKRWYGAGS